MKTIHTTKPSRPKLRPLARAATAAVGSLALLSGVVLLGGCYTPTVNSVEVSESGASKSTVTDARLARAGLTTRVNKGKAGDRMRVTVEVTNTTDDPHTIMYRFSWRDGSGFPIESSTTTWIREYIQGRQTKTLDGTAPRADAADVKVEMQLADQ
jgi:uncharacterized protein YcfL